jgi:hypothetical protein
MDRGTDAVSLLVVASSRLPEPMAVVIGVWCRLWLHRHLRSPLYLEPPPWQERES